MLDVNFISTDYRNIEIHGGVIYCDPPYAETTKYTGLRSDFDCNEFYNWCVEVAEDNYVLLSEYSIPDSYGSFFECVWSKDTMVNFDSGRDNDQNRRRTADEN